MRQSFKVLALLLVLALSSVFLYSQAISGNIVGSVTDSQGNSIVGASVTAVNSATGVKASTTTNGSGEYRLLNLPAGIYNLSVSSKGFSDQTQKGFKLDLNKNATVNFAMKVGEVATSIDVTTIAQVIDTTTPQVQNTFDTAQLRDLPSATLNALNLSLLSSGVSSSGGVGAGSGPTVGGQRPRDNNFTVEGVDNNSKSVTGPLIYIPNDAVGEFTVLQNQIGPEFGHSAGGQFNQTVKSGTNAFHGTLYEYMQNRNLNAIDNQTILSGFTSNQRYDNNRLGGTIGGPVIKNKLFFFANYEYNPIGQSGASGQVVVPTAAGYASIAAASGAALNNNNLTIFKQYAGTAAAGTAFVCVECPIVAGKTVPNVAVGPITINSPNFSNSYAFVGSMDYNMSEHDQIRGRYIWNKISPIDTAAQLPAFFQSNPVNQDLVTLSEYHTFNPSVQNELRLGFNRYANTTPSGNFTFPGLDSFPNLSYDELNLQIGPDPNAPQFTIQNFYQVADNLSWNKGRHNIKVGYEFRKYISPQSFTQRARGDYEYSYDNGTFFTNAATGKADGGLGAYLIDTSPDGLAERSLGNNVYYGDQIASYWYINDTWKFRPNLTISLGLRHEYTTIPVGERVQSLNSAASVAGLIDFSEPRAPKKNFMPRVGFAWTPSGSSNTSVRGGFGISYDVLYDNIGILSLPPQLSGTIDVDPGVPNFLKNGGILPSAGGIQTFPTVASQRANTANHIVVDQKDPYSIQWNLGVQHVFAKSYTAEVRYLGTRGVHLNVQQRINRQAKVSPTVSLPTFLAAPTQAALDALTLTLAQIQANSNFTPALAAAGFNAQNLVQFSPDGGSIYHGLATELTHTYSNGLQFKASYTWSKLIDDSTADFFTTLLTPRRSQDFQNLGRDRSRSALDHTHRLTFSALYDVPWFKHGNWFAKNIAGNWRFAPVYTIQSPEYATVQSGTDSNLNGDSFGDRAIFNPAGVAGTGSGVTALKNTAGATVGYLAKNPNAQYIQAGAGVYPSLGRNTLPLARINNWDMSIVKRFSITERMNFEFGSQFFNFFNHPQFVPGSLNQITSIGFTSTQTRNFLNPSNAIFNNPRAVFSSNSRAIQLSGKFNF